MQPGRIYGEVIEPEIRCKKTVKDDGFLDMGEEGCIIIELSMLDV